MRISKRTSFTLAALMLSVATVIIAAVVGLNVVGFLLVFFTAVAGPFFVWQGLSATDAGAALGGLGFTPTGAYTEARGTFNCSAGGISKSVTVGARSSVSQSRDDCLIRLAIDAGIQASQILNTNMQAISINLDSITLK